VSDPEQRPGPDREAFVGADPYREWDAAYLLGALSPGERREFEEHLTGCVGCQAEVAEVAGVPGLLSQIGPEDVPGILDALPVTPAATGEPSAALPWPPQSHGGQDSERRTRVTTRGRRPSRAAVLLAAVCMLLAGVIGVATVHGTFSVSRPSAAARTRLAFSSVRPSGITAVVDVVPVPTGTELRVECQYAADYPSPNGAGSDYALVVTDHSGRSTVVRTWTARTDHLMTPSGTSPLRVTEIADVEIRQAGSDEVLLRADLG
jgi:hypothetical protein